MAGLDKPVWPHDRGDDYLDARRPPSSRSFRGDSYSDAATVARLHTIIGPYPERFMEAYPVSKLVYSPAHDAVDIIEMRDADT